MPKRNTKKSVPSEQEKPCIAWKIMCIDENEFMKILNEFAMAVDKYNNNGDIARYMVAAYGKDNPSAFVAGYAFGRYIQKEEDTRALIKTLGLKAIESQEDK